MSTVATKKKAKRVTEIFAVRQGESVNVYRRRPKVQVIPAVEAGEDRRCAGEYCRDPNCTVMIEGGEAQPERTQIVSEAEYSFCNDGFRSGTGLKLKDGEMVKLKIQAVKA